MTHLFLLITTLKAGEEPRGAGTHRREVLPATRSSRAREACVCARRPSGAVTAGAQGHSALWLQQEPEGHRDWARGVRYQGGGGGWHVLWGDSNSLGMGPEPLEGQGVGAELAGVQGGSVGRRGVGLGLEPCPGRGCRRVAGQGMGHLVWGMRESLGTRERGLWAAGGWGVGGRRTGH